MLVVLDWFFLIFHTGFILFIITGWMFRKSVVLKLHLLMIFLTAVSWFGLGLYYGIGYCFCTDWHWQVRRSLGDTNLPNSYIKYLLDRMTGLDWPVIFVDSVTVLIYFLAIILSSYFNVIQYRRQRNSML